MNNIFITLHNIFKKKNDLLIGISHFNQKV